MGDLLSTYSIQFKGLKVGKHLFNFEVDDRFFKEFEESDVRKGKLLATVTLDKHSQMLELKIAINGYVEVVCDRCLDAFDLPIKFEGVLYVKFGEGVPDAGEEILFLPTEDSELELGQYIYESICLSIPYQKYHGINGTNEKDCDKEMLKNLKKHTVSKKGLTENIDPRWDKLKDLKLN